MSASSNLMCLAREVRGVYLKGNIKNVFINKTMKEYGYEKFSND